MFLENHEKKQQSKINGKETAQSLRIENKREANTKLLSLFGKYFIIISYIFAI